MNIAPRQFSLTPNYSKQQPVIQPRFSKQQDSPKPPTGSPNSNFFKVLAALGLALGTAVCATPFFQNSKTENNAVVSSVEQKVDDATLKTLYLKCQQSDSTYRCVKKEENADTEEVIAAKKEQRAAYSAFYSALDAAMESKGLSRSEPNQAGRDELDRIYGELNSQPEVIALQKAQNQIAAEKTYLSLTQHYVKYEALVQFLNSVLTDETAVKLQEALNNDAENTSLARNIAEYDRYTQKGKALIELELSLDKQLKTQVQDLTQQGRVAYETLQESFVAQKAKQLKQSMQISYNKSDITPAAVLEHPKAAEARLFNLFATESRGAHYAEFSQQFPYNALITEQLEKDTAQHPTLMKLTFQKEEATQQALKDLKTAAVVIKRIEQAVSNDPHDTSNRDLPSMQEAEANFNKQVERYQQLSGASAQQIRKLVREATQ